MSKNNLSKVDGEDVPLVEMYAALRTAYRHTSIQERRVLWGLKHKVAANVRAGDSTILEILAAIGLKAQALEEAISPCSP